MGLTNFPFGITSFGIPVLANAFGIPFTGNYWFVDPLNGLDGNSGNSPSNALKTLYRAQLLAASDNNDVVILMGSGDTTGTARLSLANAQAVTSTVTAGTLVWAKNAVHLIGVAAPAGLSARARLAPPSGVYTQATFGSGNFVNVTAGGCLFANVSLFNGFSTGGVNQICWTENGGRNAYINVDFGGMGDAASAADAGSRSLLVKGTGENSFYHCNVGLDTISRGAANASLEFSGGTTRNTFEDCTFPFDASASTPLGILCTGVSAIDRWQLFKRCQFMNAVSSGATTMSVLASMTNAAPGGYLNFDAACAIIGITKWGDTNALANSYVSQPVPTAATSGIAVKPS